jgi:hypothetical protein
MSEIIVQRIAILLQHDRVHQDVSVHEQFLDDSLAGKLCNFTFKNRLKTNCTTQGVFQHSQGLTGKVQLCHLGRYSEPMSKGTLVIFTWLESTTEGNEFSL